MNGKINSTSCATTANIMSYRQKTCPYCSTVHKQRGPFCSKACSNKNRRHSTETKQKMSRSQSHAQSKPENLEKTWHARTTAQLILQANNLKINPDTVETNPDNLYLPPLHTHEGTVADGDLWFDVD